MKIFNNIRNRNKIWLLFLCGIIVFIILICFINIFSAASEKLISKNNQIDLVYENWLLLKSDVLFYLSSPGRNSLSEREHLLSSFERFDFSMQDIADEKVFRRMEKYYGQIRDIRQCLIFEWQKIQYKLAFVLYNGDDNLEQFASLVIWVSRDTQEMDRFLKLLQAFSQKINIKQQKINLFLSYAVIILFLFLVFGLVLVICKMHFKLKADAEMERMTAAAMNIRNKERKRIALDIHDSIVYRLKEIKAYADGNLDGQNKQVISDELTCIIEDARNISFNLVPFISSDERMESFLNTVRNYAAEVLFVKNINVKVSGLGVRKLIIPHELLINLFRIIQEALNNITKHSRAKNVEIKIIYSFPYIIMSIADDGMGMSENKISTLLNKEHIGLYGMNERVKAFGGTLIISSKSGDGTKITAKIPYKKDS